MWKGKLDETSAGGVPSYLVAVKLSKSAPNERTNNELFKEAAVMAQVPPHSNVVSLIGVCTTGTPILLLMSYCENSSLRSCLINYGIIIDVNSKLQIALDIARGMEHLSKHHVIHRDLATRNVLVDVDNTCKVADFGLSRITAANADYFSSAAGNAMAIRWTAPEALKLLQFNEASDVWSFGITLVEVFNNGVSPYYNMDPVTLTCMLENGFRHVKPDFCPGSVYKNVLLKCWKANPARRPTFTRIGEFFDQYIPVHAAKSAKKREHTSGVLPGAHHTPEQMQLGTHPWASDGSLCNGAALAEAAAYTSSRQSSSKTSGAIESVV